MPDKLVHQLNTLKSKIYWLVLTEPWCGDASQTLPVFNSIARSSKGMVELSLVYRDENPELMDAYLTRGTKSIPKLIQLNANFKEIGIWGPRPAAAQKLVNEIKSDPETSSSYGNPLHLWYAKDKQKSLETEISELLFKGNIISPDLLQ